MKEPQEGQILIGPSFNEPVQVETVRCDGHGTWTVGVVGARSEQFRRVVLTEAQLETLQVLSHTSSFQGDGIEHETAQGRQVYDVHEKNLGYDLTSLDLNSGELRLIEVKGIGATEGTVVLRPHEHQVAEDRRDCYWLYVVTDCNGAPKLTAAKDPASRPWQPVRKVAHFLLPTQMLLDATNHGPHS